MVFTQNVMPNLVDWARMADPDGTIADIAYLLAQCNDVLKDMIWQEGNLPLGHKISANVGLPQGTWRGNNQGVPSTKPVFAQYQFSIGELVDYSMVDKSEANLNGDVAKFRWTQDNTHIEGLSQQVATAMFYSNEATNPQQFTGFSPYYNTLSTTSAMSAYNVIDGGGTASANSSLWLVGWGDNTTFGIFPKGSQAGLVYEDKGDIVPLYDSNGNRFEGYTSYFAWKVGLCIKNWKYNVRIANLDTTTAGLLGTAPPDLNVLMSEAINKLPTATRRASGITESDAPGDPVPGINPAWYCNRTVRTALDVQAIRDKNVLIGMKEYAGEPVMMWRDVPVRVVDALTTSEDAVA
jgi:hypothetical protein